MFKWGFVVFICQNLFAAEGFYESPIKAVHSEAWNSTVRIEVVGKNRKVSSKAFRSHGSGFVVQAKSGRQLVATNVHVAACSKEYRCQLKIVHTNNLGKTQMYSGTIVSAHPLIDLAFIELSKKVRLPTAQLSDQLASVADTLYPIGYPSLRNRDREAWDAQRPDNTSSQIKRASHGALKTVIRNLKVNQFKGSETQSYLMLPLAYFHDADTLPGNSGGPIVDDHGVVRAITVGTAAPRSDDAHCGATQNCSYVALPSTVILEKLQSL